MPRASLFGMDFDTLNKKARDQGVALKDAYHYAGISYMTFWRHSHRQSRPHASTARLIADIINEMPNGVRWKDHWREGLKRQYVRLRKNRAFTQGEVEDRLGVTPALVGKYEANMRTPNAFMLCCWADVLDGTLTLIPNEVLPEITAILEAYYARS